MVISKERSLRSNSSLSCAYYAVAPKKEAEERKRKKRRRERHRRWAYRGKEGGGGGGRGGVGGGREGGRWVGEDDETHEVGRGRRREKKGAQPGNGRREWDEARKRASTGTNHSPLPPTGHSDIVELRAETRRGPQEKKTNDLEKKKTETRKERGRKKEEVETERRWVEARTTVEGKRRKVKGGKEGWEEGGKTEEGREEHLSVLWKSIEESSESASPGQRLCHLIGYVEQFILFFPTPRRGEVGRKGGSTKRRNAVGSERAERGRATLHLPATLRAHIDAIFQYRVKRPLALLLFLCLSPFSSGVVSLLRLFSPSLG